MTGRPHLTPDDIRDIKAARAAGETFSSIARRLGCSPSTVKHHAQPRTKPRALQVNKCPGCPLLFTTPGKARIYCTPDCREAHHARVRDRERRELIAEVEWVAGTDTWDNIAVRLGYSSSESLERTLHRMGAHDWGRRVHEQTVDAIRWGRAA